MAEIRPFRAMMYNTDRGIRYDALCCPPYDIISPEEQARLCETEPYNAIRLELAPGEGEARYENAAATLAQWLRDGILKIEDEDAFYIYEEAFSSAGRDYTLRGLIARVVLEEFEKKIVLPHEETLSHAKQDRFDLMRATNCNFSQVYSLYYDGEHAITPQIDAAADRRPDIEFTWQDGVTHRLWIVRDGKTCGALSAAFRGKQLFIADGHHRYETALNYRDYLRRTTGSAGNADSIMMMLVDIEHPGLVVLPTHRILFGLPHFDAAAAIEALKGTFTAEQIARDTIDAALSAAEGTAFALYAKQGAWLLTLRDRGAMKTAVPDHSDAYRALDVSVLHSLILEPCFGIDREKMARGENLRYTRDAKEAIREVDEGRAQAAFLLNPTRVGQIRDVALAGDKMPQKSTYFYPKLITGLVFNNFRY